MKLEERARELREIVSVQHCKIEVDRDGDTLCKCGKWFLHIHPGSFEKHVEDMLLSMLTQLQAEARLACSEQVRTAASMQPDAAVRKIILAIADGLEAAAPATKEG